MRKVFSYFVLALCLIVSTQVKADEVSVSNWDDLKAAINGAKDAGSRTIVVSQDIATNGTWPDDIADGQTITIVFENDAVLNHKGYGTLIYLLHGTLDIQGTGKIISTSASGAPMIWVMGSTLPNAENYSVLKIGENITVSNTASNYAIGILEENLHGPHNEGKAYGVSIDIAGYVYGKMGGITINGNIQSTLGNVPEINISGTVECNADLWKNWDGSVTSYPNAIYAAGYANWTITGTVQGALPLYVKAGSVTLDGATVIASGTYVAPTLNNNGSDGCGSAIVYDSNASYADHLSLTIEGNTKVYSEFGYAIEELATSGEEKMGDDDFIIESGTFSGGQEGCIKTTEIVKQQIQEHGTISGGSFINAENIWEYLNTNNGVLIPVVNGSDVVYVVGNMPSGKEWTNEDINLVADGSYVQYKDAAVDFTLTKNVTIDYLSMADPTYAAKITIPAGKVLRVGEVVLGDNAQIIVEAGGKLIIDGVNGLIAFDPDNLVLKADATGMGMFLLSPNVKANKQPHATVYYYAKHAKQKGDNRFIWDRFASVFASIEKVETMDKGSIPTYQNTPWKSYFEYWDATNNKWVACQYTENGPLMEVSKGYKIANASLNGGVTYKMQGQLQGTNNLKLAIEKGENYFGNSLTAPIDIKELATLLLSKGINSIYLWNAAEQRYETVNAMSLQQGTQSYTEIPAMHTFIFDADVTKTTNVFVNYEQAVYNYNTK